MTRVLRIHLIHDAADAASADDILELHTHQMYPGQVRLYYTSVYMDGSTSESTTTLSQDAMMAYIHNLLRSLEYDADPFYQIQLSPSIGPMILFDVCDLEHPNIFRAIENTVWTAIYNPIRNV